MEMNRRSGFTLVELAIVLVIIGLIIGGVLAGATLIRNAELRAIITDRDKIETAINTFRVKYNALPGDMKNATTIWGEADPDPATCFTIVSPGKETCNGNGNKRIWDAQGTNPLEPFEIIRVWQHLSNAELINGSFTGAPDASATAPLGSVFGVNTPVSKLAEAGWFTEYVGNMSPAEIAAAAGNADMIFPGQYAQMLALGAMGVHPFVGSMPIKPFIPAEDAYALDLKMDDGKPGQGVLKSLAPFSGGNDYDNDCATTNDPATAEYNMESQLNCALLFKMKL